jgi:periplasmic copper chaperone A
MKHLAGVVCFCLLIPEFAAASVTQIAVANAWSRPANDVGVVYATLINNSARVDKLLSVRTPIARNVEIHESVSSSGPMGAMASMHRVGFIAIPAQGRVVLRPGGYHLMLIGLRNALKPGAVFTLELNFEHAGRTKVQVHVREMD